MITSINIFSFLHNCKLVFVENKDVDINKTVNKMHFSRQPNYVIDICSRIVGRINNNHFSFYDFKLYVFMMYLLKDKVNWKDIVLTDVIIVSKKCSNERYLKDNTFVDSILNKLDMEFSDLLKVNSNGNNILLDLILQGKISPVYYVMRYNQPEEYLSNVEFKISNDLNRINKRTEITKNILRR